MFWEVGHIAPILLGCSKNFENNSKFPEERRLGFRLVW